MLKRFDDAWNVAALRLPKNVNPAKPASSPAAPRLGKPLNLDALQRSFGKRSVLDGLSLEVPAGQFVAIVGRSGVGKSTLMRLIVGLDQPIAGRVFIDGTPVAGLQKSVGLLFQDPRLLPWQTVLGNVGIARLPGWRETALKALDDVGLADRRHDWPAMLSGGQRQRVALARVLVARPSILLLDEPFGALDALTRTDMHVLLEALWLQHGFTTLLITHDVAEAVALADRVVVIKNGRVGFSVDVTASRPRRRADPTLVALQARILDEV
jgi:sulfonate transport system ATP-binding protein